jgi:predicted phosphodiesterase
MVQWLHRAAEVDNACYRLLVQTHPVHCPMPPNLRLAILADAHGNAFALEAVLKEVRAVAPDLIVNLGDQVWGRADPGRAYALQRNLNAIEVRGNNEEKLTRAPEILGGRRRFHEWLLAQLPDGAVQHLAGLPLTAAVADDAVLLAHGTPRDANRELLWGWSPNGWCVREPDELRTHLQGVGAKVVVVGHSHREGTMALDDWLLVNAGSAGWQLDGDPRARWTLLERHRGRWLVQFYRVPYDTEAAARWVLAQDPSAQVEAKVYQTGYETGAP